MSSEWPTVSIGDIAGDWKGSMAVGPFGSRMKADLYVPSGVRVIRGNNLSGGREPEGEYVHVSVETADSLASCCLMPGDLVFPHRGNIGEVGITPDDGRRYMLSTSLMKLSPDRKKVDPLYLMYFFKSAPGRAALLMNASQVGTPGIATPLKSLRSIQLPLPPLVTQKKIADTLSKLDDRITHLRETNTTLEAIAQALFKSWFVDFDPVHAKMQGRAPEGMDEATAALFPDSFEESELGAVPKGWSIKAMADVSTVGIGKTPPRKEQHWFSESPSDVRWVSIRDMGSVGVYAAVTSEFLTTDAVEKFNVRRAPDNTVLMSFKMTIGRVAITDGEMTTNEAIAHFKLEPGAPITSEFIYLHLKQFDFSKLSSTSSIADAVNSKTVREIPILVPSFEVLRAFQDQVGVLFSALKNREQHAQSIAQMRDALLPRLISGQLKLNEALESLQ
jgi:type I restriction enzyme S subunit